MKTIILTAALSLLVSLAGAETNPPGGPSAGGSVAEPSIRGGAFLGVGLETAEDRVTVNYVVPGGPAARAGVGIGAIILGIDGSPVKGDYGTVTQAVRAKNPGDEIELQWRAGNSMKAARIKLGARTDSGTDPAPKGDGDLSKKVKEQMDQEEAGAKEHDRQPSRKEFAPDGSPADHRFTPGPRRKFFKEAERQIKELAPEIEVDPYRRSGEDYRWKAVPLMDPPRAEKKYFLHSEGLSGPADWQLKDVAPELQVDPYKEPDMMPPPSVERGKLQLKKPPLLKEGKPADRPGLWKQEGKPGIDESLLWEKVRARVGKALDNSDLEPAVKQKVMAEIERARAEGAAQEAQQAKLEAEIQILEKSAHNLQQRAAELRRQWEKGQK